MSFDDAKKQNPSNEEGKLLSEFNTPSYDEWKTEVERLLRGAPFDKKMLTKTHEGITLQPLYRKEDIQDLPHLGSMPGSAPFARGMQSFSYGEDSWLVAQEINYPTYTEFNEALQYDLKRGLQAVNLPLDIASRQGLDPDFAEIGEVGAEGVSISSVKGLGEALKGIDLNAIPLYIKAGACGLPYAGMLSALVKKNGFELAKLNGAIATDPLGELAADGKLSLSLDKLYDEMAILTSWAKDNTPKLGTIWVHGEVYNDGGASATQELAYVLATAVEYLREMEKRGLAIETVLPHIRFSFAVGTNFFMEVAKLRAARILWNQVLESCDIPEDKRYMWTHVRTSRYTKTQYDPYVNMLRTTTEAFSGVVGGADSMHVGPFDEPIRVENEFSRRIARNTQYVLKDEANLAKIIDPAGGSWYVEKLTAEVAEYAWTIFQEIEAKDGIYSALKSGWIQSEIERVADMRMAALSTRQDIQVGTNQYPNSTEEKLEVHPVDYEKIHADRSLILQNLRTSSSHKEEIAVLQKLETLLNASSEEVFAAVEDVAAHGATIGEIVKTLRAGDDSTDSIEPVKVHRASEKFEELRDAVEAAAKAGKSTKVFLATLGQAGKYMPRLDFAASFFSVGGFDVIRNTGFDTAKEAAEEAIKAEAPVVVVVGLDDSYVEGAPEVAKAVKADDPKAKLILAGYPADEELRNKFSAAGIDLFIHVKSNVYQTLTDLAFGLEVL